MNISHIIPKVDTENGKQLEAESLHQAWRYGKRLNEQQEERSTRELTKILGELKKELL
ncbi:MAG: hypothetical protein GY765_27675 [bacterium]|nr:hypothetical protein [bacterium]